MILVGQTSVQKGSEIYTQILNNMYKYDGLYILAKLKRHFIDSGVRFETGDLFWLWDELSVCHSPQQCSKPLQKYALQDRRAS